MTGRELIIYILENHLEDESVFKDEKFIGLLSVSEVAERMNVGIATVYVWIHQKRLKAIPIYGAFYIPADFKLADEGTTV